MKYAFLILAHNDPVHLRQLVDALDDERFDIYIHLDSKVDDKPYRDASRQRSSTVRFIDDRFDIRWGGITMVRAMIALYQYASKTGNYERYTMLSGADYPLMSPTDIVRFFLESSSVELIAGNRLAGDELRKVTTHNLLELRSRVLRRLSRLLLGHVRTKPSHVLIDGRHCPSYFAPQWSSLSEDCVRYLLNTLENNPQIWRYFKYSYAPDELMIPTIIFNSPFSATTLARSFPQGTHYNDKCATHYINYEPVVQVFTLSDYETLVQSGKPFCRKLRTGPSDELILRLIEHNCQDS